MGPQPPGAPGTSLSLQAVPGTQASGVASDQGTEAKQRCWAKVSSCLAPVGGQTGFFEKWKHDFRPAGDVPHPSHVKCDRSMCTNTIMSCKKKNLEAVSHIWEITVKIKGIIDGQ